MPSLNHPFDPLTPGEISKAAHVVRSLFPGKLLNFHVITLQEPEKREMVKYLEKELGSGVLQMPPTRAARVQFVKEGETSKQDLHEVFVDLDRKIVTKQQHLEGKMPYIDAAYMQEVEQVCMADARVQAEIRELCLPEGAAACAEPWAYATDGQNDMSTRVTMVGQDQVLLLF